MKFGKNKKNTSREPQLRPAGRSLPVNNYYRSTKAKPSATVTDKKSDNNKKKNISVSKIINFLLIGGAVGLVVFATTLTTTPVVELKKNNAEYYESAVYEKAAQEILKSNVFYRSKILFPNVSFENKLKERFPEISRATPVVPLGGRNLSIIVTVSEPFAYVSSGSDTGIVNNEGVLVVKNANSVPDDLFKLRFTEPQSNFDIGSRILTTSEVDLLTLLQNEMNSLAFNDGTTAKIKDALFNVSQGQIEATIVSKQFFIKLSSFNAADVQVGGAKATLRQLDREATLPTKYIDVRVPGRAFVL